MADGKLHLKNGSSPSFSDLIAPDGKHFHEHGILVKTIKWEHIAGDIPKVNMDVVFDPNKFDLDLTLPPEQIALTIGDTMERRLARCGLEGWEVVLRKKRKPWVFERR